jgi:hypothetical protein
LRRGERNCNVGTFRLLKRADHLASQAIGSPIHDEVNTRPQLADMDCHRLIQTHNVQG